MIELRFKLLNFLLFLLIVSLICFVELLGSALLYAGLSLDVHLVIDLVGRERTRVIVNLVHELGHLCVVAEIGNVLVHFYGLLDLHIMENRGARLGLSVGHALVSPVSEVF